MSNEGTIGVAMSPPMKSDSTLAEVHVRARNGGGVCLDSVEGIIFRRIAASKQQRKS
jgi:hypothetical protein